MIRISGLESLTKDRLYKIVIRHDARRMELERLLRTYLHGSPPDKKFAANGRVNNCVNSNLAKYITDTATGYFMGVPPKYTFDEEVQSAGEAIQEVFDSNNETSLNYMLAESMSIYGVAYDAVRIDDNGKIRITQLDSREVFVVYDDTLDNNVLAIGRIYKILNDNETWDTYLDVYTSDALTTYRTNSGVLNLVKEEPLHFGAVPVTIYKNNAHMTGDFAAVLDNLQQYNLVLSNTADDLHSTANAFLALTGMEDTDEETIERMNQTRVALLPDGNANAFYVTKTLDATASENHKRTLRRDILQVAGVPDLSDESFAGNSSGVALEYKMWGLDQIRAKKQQGMDEGLFARLRLISTALRLQGHIIPDGMERMTTISYTRNMPRDKTGEIDNAVKLHGIVSDETVYKMLEPVTGTSVVDELEKTGMLDNAE